MRCSSHGVRPDPFSYSRRGRGRILLQYFGADLAGGDLAQRDHGRFVAVRLDQRRGAGAELARAVSRASVSWKRWEFSSGSRQR